MTLPEFTTDGILPPGDYELTFASLRDSFLVTGEGLGPNWDSEWRSKLVDNLETMVNQLWTMGLEEIFINGSFVEKKDHPNDIDGYFVCPLKYFASGKLHKDLNFLDPGIWTWSPSDLKKGANSAKRQLPMWLVYRVELYPHYGQFSGLRDKQGHELQFPSAFRQRCSDGKQKGIIRLVKGETS